jgi:hypothetical protein
MRHYKKRDLGINCSIDGCHTKARFLIGSLQREIDGLNKFLYVCATHDNSIAKNNAQIHRYAKEANLTIIQYIRLRG